MTQAEKRAKEIFAQQIGELQKVSDRIGPEMNQVVEMIYACRGKLVIMGVGKTGIIGHKILSSFHCWNHNSLCPPSPPRHRVCRNAAAPQGMYFSKIKVHVIINLKF